MDEIRLCSQITLCDLKGLLMKSFEIRIHDRVYIMGFFMALTGSR